ncbi:MAG TPA: tRNA epoxyqueuosine(34) reductase QueG [Candidatus Paceibacterota bacterium]|nr:tRNA epoxyqueuosine(34) reductase QueG [Candidatus Paceibacterota bacterium]
MKEKIRQRALESGFDDCRFTSAAPPENAPRFSKWLEERQHGEMNWLERNAPKRIDPQKVLPGAKSIICLAASYGGSDKWQVTSGKKPHTPGSCHPPLVTRHGIIARCASFDDYHVVLGERLKLLAQFANQLGGEENRSLWYVDTGPVLERDLAQRAGLGFAGKHTNLISRKLGNWIFLAEILTTLELEPDAPEQNHCGKCSRCISACPTNAITAPFQLDARRCISYLTIELKGPIPIEFRRAIGNRIYGCDDCLAVCPWNRFAREGSLMKSHARKDLEQPDLIELLQLDEANFKSRFSGSPVLRTKRRGLLRNVCVVLGNVGDVSALPHLRKIATDPEPLIAEHAHWAIEQIGTFTNS